MQNMCNLNSNWWISLMIQGYLTIVVSPNVLSADTVWLPSDTFYHADKIYANLYSRWCFIQGIFFMSGMFGFIRLGLIWRPCDHASADKYGRSIYHLVKIINFVRHTLGHIIYVWCCLQGGLYIMVIYAVSNTVLPNYTVTSMAFNWMAYSAYYIDML